MILFMDESKKSLQLIYNLCLFYLGNLLTSLFLRNIVGELVFIVGVVIVTVALYRLSRIQGYGLKGGCVCLTIAFVLSLLKVPENMALYLMVERPAEEYIHGVSEFVIKMEKWQGVEQIIVGSSLVLKLIGWILWMHNTMFARVKKMFYFLFADLLIGMLVLGIRSVEEGFNYTIYLSFANYIAHALALMALGIIVYRVGGNVVVLQKKRKYYAFILCFLTVSCYLPFLFVGYMSYQIFLLVGCIVFLYGIKIWSLENRQLNVFCWWLCVIGVIVGIVGYRVYCVFTVTPLRVFYWVFVIWGMVAVGYGMMMTGDVRNKQIFGGLSILSVLLIPLTLLYSRGITFFMVAVVWAWIWMPLWILCMCLLVKKYIQSLVKKNNGFVEN